MKTLLPFLSIMAPLLLTMTVQAQTKPVSYSKDIFPIFRTACSGCHNSETDAGGLNLTTYAAALKGGRGGALWTAGKSADSRIIKYLSGSLKPQMPPGGGLKQPDIDHIRQWIDAGAKADTLTEPTRKAPEAAKHAVRPASSVAAVKSSTLFVLKKAAPVTALAFGPDGKTLAVGTYREVQFWNLETGQMTGKWSGHPDTIRALVYSKDGKWLAAGGGTSGAAGEVRIWSVAEGRETQVLGEHTDVVNGVAFNPEGTKLATASADKSIKTWDLKTGKSLATGKEHSDAVWGIAWSPDGKYIASCSADHSIKIWEPTALKRLYSLGGHEDVVYSVEFGPNNVLLSASADRTARLWNIGPEGGSSSRTLAGHKHNVLNATFSANGSAIATSSADKSVKIWGQDGSNPRTFTDAKDWVYVARYSKDQKLLAAGTWDGTILIWNTADGNLQAQFSTAPKTAPAAKSSDTSPLPVLKPEKK